MITSLSNLVDNLTEGIHKVICKDCDCFLEYENVKEHSNKIDEELKKRFKSTFKFSNNYIIKFILLLRKSVYPYENMYDWEKFYEASLPEKPGFYSNLNMVDITDADYMNAR